MKLIKQRHKNDCGVAAFAMIMNLSYRKAMKILFPKRFWWFENATTHVEMLQEACAKLGYLTAWTTLTDIRTITTRAIVVIKLAENKYHAVVWDPLHQKILDPSHRDLDVEFCAKHNIGSIFIIP